MAAASANAEGKRGELRRGEEAILMIIVAV